MAEVKFYLERRDSDKSVLPILLYFSFNGDRLQYNTGKSVDKKYYNDEYWKTSRKPIKTSAPNALLLNKALTAFRLHVEKMHSDMTTAGTVPTKKAFRTSLDATYKNKGASVVNGYTMSQIVDLYLAEVERDMAPNTLKNKKTALIHFKNYWRKKGNDSEPLASQNFSDEFFRDLQKYIQKEAALNNTAVKYLNVVRSFFGWMRRQKHIAHFEFNLSLTENAINVIFLNEEEVKHLAKVVYKQESLARVRDVFVFGCFTGMRYSDIKNLKKTDIVGNTIRFYNQKNGTTVAQTVSLLPQAKEILERYAVSPTQSALPVISNQKMNAQLKKVMEEAEFDYHVTIAQKSSTGKITNTIKKKYELITCHTSRESFITIALNSGMPEVVIKCITGHSKNSRAFAAYYTIREELMKTEMLKAFGNI